MKTFAFAELSKRLVFFWLMALTCAANAGEFDALLGSDNFKDFTPAERALFEDAHHSFKKYEIPKDIIGSAIHWIDNDRVAFSSRSYLGWKAQPSEPSHIISYNLQTKEIVDSGYRGIIRCLNHQGDMLIHQADKEDGTYSKPETYRWFSGKWGKPLESVDYLPNSFIPHHVCRFIKYDEPIFEFPPESLPPDAARLTPLLPGHGFLKETVVRENAALKDQLFLIKPNGQTSFLGNRRLDAFTMVYLPWSGAYFEPATSRTGPRTIFLSGKAVIHQAPLLIRFWTHKGFSTAEGFAFRGGILWAVQHGSIDWRKQGVYKEVDGKLTRIEAGLPIGDIPISPNGCLAKVGVHDGDPFELQNKNHVYVIDVCPESMK